MTIDLTQLAQQLKAAASSASEVEDLKIKLAQTTQANKQLSKENKRLSDRVAADEQTILRAGQEAVTTKEEIHVLMRVVEPVILGCGITDPKLAAVIIKHYDSLQNLQRTISKADLRELAQRQKV